jgi:hypothetical protein
MDERYQQYDESGEVTWYREDNSLTDGKLIGRDGREMFDDQYSLAEALYKFRLDDAEFAAAINVIILMAAKKANFDPKLIADFSASLFNNLRKHYEENYEDIAVRLGNIMLFVDGILAIRRKFDEHIVILKLCRRDGTMSENSAAEKIISLADCAQRVCD